MGAGWPQQLGHLGTAATSTQQFDPHLQPASTFTPSQSFEAEENVKTAFVQSDFKGEVGGHALRFNAGVRYSGTDTNIDNFKQQGAGLVYRRTRRRARTAMCCQPSAARWT
jgi:iron complex outermembrane receptor protein